MKILRALALVIATGLMAGSAVTPARAVAASVPSGIDARIRLDWEAGVTRRGQPVIRGYVINDHGRPAADVRLLVESLDASGAVVGRAIGFVPGLPYMDLPERLTIKRLDTPRTKTPPGSVSIGGNQCCIYPVDSPGGFWVLGRTPVRLYDPTAPDPILLRAGDHVRFRPIDRAEYDAIAARVGMGRWGKVEEIAWPCVFLASEASSWMTGETIVIDGGPSPREMEG